jgi:hypothetical protein
LVIPLKPGKTKNRLLDGATILKYINEAADEYKVRDHIVTNKRQ